MDFDKPTPYREAYPAGTRVRIADRAFLEQFAQEWPYHHTLQPGQMEFAGAAAVVRAMGFYHGGDPVYEPDGAPGYWLELCLGAE